MVAVPDQPTLTIDCVRPWQLVVGFEGFEETVDFQLAAARAIAADLGLSDLQRHDYSPREGICQRFFDILDRRRLSCGPICLPDRVVGFHGGRRRKSCPDAAVID